MIKLSILETFQPELTSQALEKVRTLHPTRKRVAMEVDSQFLEKLKSLLLRTPFPELPELAQSLNVQYLRGSLLLLCLEDEERLVEKAEIVILQRRRRDLLAYAWYLLKMRYPVPRLERVARVLGKKFGWKRVVPAESLSDRISAWFVSSPLDSSILRDFLQSGATKLESWLENVDIHRNSGLFRAVRRRLLMWFDKATIDRLGHEYLLKIAQDERDQAQREFAARYLNQLKTENHWQFPVLNWIKGKFGSPPREAKALTLFWKSVESEARMRFKKWAVERALGEFFKDINDPNGRFRFWKRFSDHIIEVEKTADGDVALLDFGHFGVVEFAQIGNAAYVYPAVHFQQVRQRAARRIYDNRALKIPSRTIKKLAWDGRIIHSGAWQHRAGIRIRSLLSST